MLQRFSTGMERAQSLSEVRKSDVPLPSEWMEDNRSAKIPMLRRMLSHDPKERPTAEELLKSDFVPARIEDEYLQQALSTIANPKSPYYAKLLDGSSLLLLFFVIF